MLTKIFFLLGLILLATSYTEQNHVLILTADDFPSVIEEFPHILIEFYAPWCGHCKKLEPIYDEVAKELFDAELPVRVAKIDADAHSSVKGTYQVQGFPTLIFFANGQQIKYNGQRTKDSMVNWLSKKTRPALVPVTVEELESIATNGKVNVVFFGSADSEQGKAVSEIATADDYNTYYIVSSSEKAEGTVEIHRPFGDSLSTVGTENLKGWIQKNERPTVYPFDERTISDIFGERGVGIILFHSGEAGEALVEAFTEAAVDIRVNQGKVALIFTDVPLNSEHYSGLANYIKVATPKSPVVIIDGSKRLKYVLKASPADLTSGQIVDFVKSFEDQSAKQYKIDEQVVYEDGTKVEDEL